MKYIKLSILRNRAIVDQNIAYIKVFPNISSNSVALGNNIRRSVFQNLIR